ncbi:MAG: hypothetical protein V2A34_02490 [Lentisphaerota bacterium]
MKKVCELFRRVFGTRQLVPLANIAEGTHEDGLSRLTDAAITTRYLLGKVGTDALHVAACGASDDPLGVIEDEAAAAEEPVNVQPLGAAKRTLKMVASEIIALDARVFTAASGKVQDLPTVNGTYYQVGRALSASGADGDVIEVDPCFPVATVVSS